MCGKQGYAINKVKRRKATRWKITLLSDKRSKSRMYGEFLQINKKDLKIPITNHQRILTATYRVKTQ